ncbi:MAG: diacylglycerol kinase family protein [Candidatus Udaeobacter sp.]
MRITLIHNPKAGDAKHGRKQLMAALAKAGHHATYQSTKEPGFKKALKQPADLVLAAGGDGTTAKVAFRLIDSGVPLSVLPLGTANNLARALGLAASPEEIIARLEGGKKQVFDVGLARGPWGERYFFEATGGGLLADYVRNAKKEERKNGKAEKLSKEQQMARHGALLRRMLHDYPARQWKIEIDGKDISGRYILWEAMNIRSVGPALHLAPQAATRDGRFDFVCARTADRARLMEHFDARVAGRKSKSPLPTRRFRELRIIAKGSTIHLDDELWREKKKTRKSVDEINITVKPSALIILQPAAAIKT